MVRQLLEVNRNILDDVDKLKFENLRISTQLKKAVEGQETLMKEVASLKKELKPQFKNI